ncbi:hypothetical protein DPEC_G00341720 [Dallia pectoralis]|uniref:Uncharacterized protein n=1 Tax=Dallia pectoralis TaxID=75939 RepID=A0ACC2F5F3_DALPE|nr:hypothetical protein DPEC_G00341720 [Dallia pectoralis]
MLLFELLVDHIAGPHLVFYCLWGPRQAGYAGLRGEMSLGPDSGSCILDLLMEYAWPAAVSCQISPPVVNLLFPNVRSPLLLDRLSPSNTGCCREAQLCM